MTTFKDKMNKANEVEKVEAPETDVNEQRKSSLFNPENRLLNTKGLPKTDEEMRISAGGDKWGGGMSAKAAKNIKKLIESGKMQIKN
ncbi:MAG: hypothetical protein WBM99_14030 [Psychromonas sp.]